MDEIRRSYEHARAAWPGVEVPYEVFAARLAKVRHAHATDLYLACGCSQANLAALAEFDRMFRTCAQHAVARIDRSQGFISEVEQSLRERLLVGPDTKISYYRGGGALMSWIRRAAIRAALNLHRRIQHEDQPEAPVPPHPGLSVPELAPEIARLRQRYMPEIQAALRHAIAALDPKDRLLLHFCYVDGLTPDRIAILARTGTSTVFRQMNTALGAVLTGTKRELSTRPELSTESLERLMRCVQDDLDLSLRQMLAPAP